GGADLSQGQGAARTDIPRGRAYARRGAPRPASAYPEHSDFVGENGTGRRSGVSARGRQRSGRNADGRDNLAGGRRIAWAGDGERGDGGSYPLDGPRAAPAHDVIC